MGEKCFDNPLSVRGRVRVVIAYLCGIMGAMCSLYGVIAIWSVTQSQMIEARQAGLAIRFGFCLLAAGIIWVVASILIALAKWRLGLILAVLGYLVFVVLSPER